MIKIVYLVKIVCFSCKLSSQKYNYFMKQNQKTPINYGILTFQALYLHKICSGAQADNSQ